MRQLNSASQSTCAEQVVRGPAAETRRWRFGPPGKKNREGFAAVQYDGGTSQGRRGDFSFAEVARFMSIEFLCPSCQQQLRVPDTAAGKNAKCPKCSSILSVPASSASA